MHCPRRWRPTVAPVGGLGRPASNIRAKFGEGLRPRRDARPQVYAPTDCNALSAPLETYGRAGYGIRDGVAAGNAVAILNGDGAIVEAIPSRASALNRSKDRETHREPRPIGGPRRDLSRLGATLPRLWRRLGRRWRVPAFPPEAVAQVIRDHTGDKPSVACVTPNQPPRFEPKPIRPFQTHRS
jgi:hypothetical protein